MKPSEIYAKTMIFVWMKLLLGVAMVIICGILLVILLGIGRMFGNPSVMLVMVFVWLGCIGFIRFLVMHYIGYLLKAGHVAVISEIVTTGKVPENQLGYGIQKVKERFLTANVYFVVDKLVSSAVKQLQRGVGVVGNLLDFIPGMKIIVQIGQLFVNIALDYIDECCLGYTFYKNEDGAFKSAADAVVIYAQNIKKLLAEAAKTTGIVILLMLGIIAVCFAVFGGVAQLARFGAYTEYTRIILFLFACIVAWAIKLAFIDSYMMVKMMVTYMEVAPTTTITFDLYGKLCKLSSQFKELFNRGQNEEPTKSQAKPSAPTSTSMITGAPVAPSSNENVESKPIFCGSCGAKNERGVKFCRECGQPMP